MPDTEELSFDESAEAASVPNSLALLEELGDDIGPSTSEVDAQESVPGGLDVLAQVVDIGVTQNEENQLRFMIQSTILTEGPHKGRRLPLMSGYLEAKPPEGKGRRDFWLWRLADATIGKEARQELQKANPGYKAQVAKVITALKGAKFGAKTKTTKRDGNEYVNVDRVYTPKGITSGTTLVIEEE